MAFLPVLGESLIVSFKRPGARFFAGDQMNLRLIDADGYLALTKEETTDREALQLPVKKLEREPKALGRK
ncbi:hypothetical protein LB542_29545 [Mesorhizobium sp. BR1-1-9]|uniref:hypothetical protein n=1 Tax=Mesorhizobium sp. BR1-1-9 TaxID=2876646 RepID=UPI001CD13351|nr:hypothetical protein [Mesorhizobium sp. BR1-1-9]MBZ9874980.1 hypothetical protein [Mesorhizobium sp. BR1-1-9]